MTPQLPAVLTEMENENQITSCARVLAVLEAQIVAAHHRSVQALTSNELSANVELIVRLTEQFVRLLSR